MNNRISENFSYEKETPKNPNLSAEWQKVLTNAISELKNNHKLLDEIKADFSNIFEALAKNPETATLLDAKVTDQMHTNLKNIQDLHANGEIYAEEAKEKSLGAITKATYQRLQIFATQNNFQMA